MNSLPKTFLYIDQTDTDKNLGVIAQDVQAVFPRAVRIRPDGSLAVDYDKLIALAFLLNSGVTLSISTPKIWLAVCL